MQRSLLSDIPEALRGEIVDFLTPCDIHALGKADAKYKSYMTDSLHRNMLSVLKNGNTKFTCFNPLESFSTIASKLHPRSVCIRSVYTCMAILQWHTIPHHHWRAILILHSGSACLQAITGLRWKDSDLDIYCTSDVAPHVRSWLLGKEVNHIFSGYNEVSFVLTITPYLQVLTD